MWPFDFSLSGFFFVFLMIVGWFLYAITQVATTAANVAKDVLKSDAGKEVGKSFLANWLDNTFNQK